MMQISYSKLLINHISFVWFVRRGFFSYMELSTNMYIAVINAGVVQDVNKYIENGKIEHLLG